MTEEEIELLVKDLCARLPYGVKCNADLKQTDGSLKSVFGKFKGYNGWAVIGNNLVDIKTIRPYLRPMSSMTVEERDEYTDIKKGECNGCVLTGKGDPDTEFLLVDWLNEHHFDYRGLIEKGLALEAPEGMYKTK